MNRLSGGGSRGSWQAGKALKPPWLSSRQKLIRNRWRELMDEATMTQVTEILEPDQDGFIELGHLADQWLLLQALRREVEELKHRIEKGEQFFKDQMDRCAA